MRTSFYPCICGCMPSSRLRVGQAHSLPLAVPCLLSIPHRGFGIDLQYEEVDWGCNQSKSTQCHQSDDWSLFPPVSVSSRMNPLLESHLDLSHRLRNHPFGDSPWVYVVFERSLGGQSSLNCWFREVARFWTRGICFLVVARGTELPA